MSEPIAATDHSQAAPTPVITARGLCKRYGRTQALQAIDLSVESGQIVGLIGPNGAGKTSLLNTLLGLTGFRGELSVLGHDPRRDRAALMQQISFIADVATLPRWLRVRESLTLVRELHPRFSESRCRAFLARSQVPMGARIGTLSKGMTVQLHLALVMAIDARLLVLDEPTLGLDLLYRRQFYESLIGDYFDAERTIVITTHQVEEIEHLLTHVLFIDAGRIVLDCAMEALGERFVELSCAPAQLEAARQARPLAERRRLGGHALIYDRHDGAHREQAERADLATLGELATPGLADLFTALMSTSS